MCSPDLTWIVAPCSNDVEEFLRPLDLEAKRTGVKRSQVMIPCAFAQSPDLSLLQSVDILTISFAHRKVYKKLFDCHWLVLIIDGYWLVLIPA